MIEFFALVVETPILFIDTETNGDDIRDGRGYCQGVSLALPICSGMYAGMWACHYMPLRHKFGFNYSGHWRSALYRALQYRKDRGLPNVYHNAKFDIASIRTLGVDPGYTFYCTMLMDHLMREEDPLRHSLNSTAAYWVGEEVSKQNKDISILTKSLGWENVPSELMYHYAMQDAALVGLIFMAMQNRWRKEGLEDYWVSQKREMVKAILDMEKIGIGVDEDICNLNIAIGNSVMAELEDKYEARINTRKFLEDALITKLGLPVFYNKKTGNPTFDKEAMEKYDSLLQDMDSELAQDVITYRGWQETVSSNYKAYLELRSHDGKLRPNYWLHGTKTGRLSCREPNLQQIPRESSKPWNGQTKLAFKVDDGFEGWEVDYSQLELRIATSYAGEEGLVRVFNEDRDLFTEMAKEMGIPRQQVKTFVYATQYGAGDGRIAEVLHIPNNEAKELIVNYYATYPGFKEIKDAAVKAARLRGYVKLWSGRRRHLDKFSAKDAFNSIVQGGAADIVERAMVRLNRELVNVDCRMLLQVHDSIIFQIRNDKSDYYLPKIAAIMVDNPKFGAKFKVEAKRFGQV